jgi:hypothetical protein
MKYETSGPKVATTRGAHGQRLIGDFPGVTDVKNRATRKRRLDAQNKSVVGERTLGRNEARSRLGARFLGRSGSRLEASQCVRLLQENARISACGVSLGVLLVALDAHGDSLSLQRVEDRRQLAGIGIDSFCGAVR